MAAKTQAAAAGAAEGKKEAEADAVEMKHLPSDVLVRILGVTLRDEPPGRSAALRTVNTDWRAAVNALTTRLKPYRMQLLRHCCPGCTFPRLQQLDLAFAGSSGWLEPAVLKQLPAKIPSVSSLTLDDWRYKGNAAALGILADIAALPNLTQLSTRGCGWLWAAGVPALAVAPLAARLTSLSVAACGPGFGDAAVAAVAMLTLMESLDLSNTAVTPAGIRGLVVPLAPRLRSLKLTRLGRAVACPAELLQMGNLTRLALLGSGMDDALVSHLSRLTNLRQLGIYLPGRQAELGEPVLAAMTGLKGLELQVSGCRTPLSTLVALTHLELEYPAEDFATVEVLRGCSRLAGLVLQDVAFSEMVDFDRELAPALLPVLGGLTSLHISNCSELSDRVCVSLFAALGGIRRLELLRCVSLTDDGLDALAQLRGLEFLDLTGSPGTLDSLGDGGWEPLGDLTNLKTLMLADNEVAEEDVEVLVRLPQLETLDLHDCDLTNARLAPLGAATQLRALDISENNQGLDNEGIWHLTGLQRLTRLTADCIVSIDHACMQAVAGLTALRFLSLEGSGFHPLPEIASCFPERDLETRSGLHHNLHVAL